MLFICLQPWELSDKPTDDEDLVPGPVELVGEPVSVNPRSDSGVELLVVLVESWVEEVVVGILDVSPQPAFVAQSVADRSAPVRQHPTEDRASTSVVEH